MNDFPRYRVRKLLRALLAGAAVFLGLQFSQHSFARGLAISFGIFLAYLVLDRFLLARWLDARS